jgi:hypothetical protein
MPAVRFSIFILFLLPFSLAAPRKYYGSRVWIKIKNEVVIPGEGATFLRQTKFFYKFFQERRGKHRVVFTFRQNTYELKNSLQA